MRGYLAVVVVMGAGVFLLVFCFGVVVIVGAFRCGRGNSG